MPNQKLNKILKNPLRAQQLIQLQKLRAFLLYAANNFLNPFCRFFSSLPSLRNKLILFLISVLLFLSLSSCDDAGCIAADDFGDYETQNLLVYSNLADMSCDYDLNNLESTVNPQLRECLTIGNPVVSDFTGNVLVADRKDVGCSGFDDASHKRLCADYCKKKCNENVSASNLYDQTTKSINEPNWIATSPREDGGSSGINIYPNSVIGIKAEGVINLSPTSRSNRYFTVDPKEYFPNSRTSDLSRDYPIDVLADQGLEMNFYGVWNDGADQGNSITETLGSTPKPMTVTYDADIQKSSINMMRRVAIYSTPHPSGFTIDDDIASNGSKYTYKSPVPLEADAEAWKCDYSDGDEKRANCSESDYVSIGYNNVDNLKASSAFPISTEKRLIGSYGGFVRFNDDGFLAKEEIESDTTVNSFANLGVSCKSDSNCDNQSKINGKDAQIFDLSDTGNFFKVAGTTETWYYPINLNSDCQNSSLELVDSSCVSIPANQCKKWNVGVGIDSSDPIKNYGSQDRSFRISSLPTNPSCANHIGLRKVKVNEIIMPISGLVSFKILNIEQASAPCKITADIVNQDGSLEEYFEGDTKKTLAISNLEVKDSFVGGYYLRKGQKIVFDPASWNDKWTAMSGQTKRCGIGMAMQIKPRPAFICPHTTSIKEKNLNCQIMVNSDGSFDGCGPNDEQCKKTDHPQKYCPNILDVNSFVGKSLVETMSDTDKESFCIFSFEKRTDSNGQEKYVAIDVNGGDIYSGENDSSPIVNFIINNQRDKTKACYVNATPLSNETTCKQCVVDRYNSRNQKPEIEINNAWQCYNLEDYRGSHSEFDAAINLITSSPSDSSAIDSLINNKGLKYLEGEHSLKDFALSDRRFIDPLNANSQDLYFGFKVNKIFDRDARVRFLALDGNRLIENSVFSGANTSYNGNDGNLFVGLSASSQYSAGRHMEVALCLEDSPTSFKCSNKDLIRYSSSNNLLVDSQFLIGSPTPTANLTEAIIQDVVKKITPDAIKTSPYEFDQFGNIARVAPISSASDCVIGDGFCHRYFAKKNGDNAEEINAKKENIKRLRLAFKINDPDGNYSDNSGQYNVALKVAIPPSEGISKIASSIIKEALEVLDGKQYSSSHQSFDIASSQSSTSQAPKVVVGSENRGLAENIYRAITNNPMFKSLLTMMMILAFSFYGLGYLIGTNDMKQATVVKMLLKIGIIYLFVDPNSGWHWFQTIFVNTFKGGVDYLTFSLASAFDDSNAIYNALATGDYSDKAALFGGVDEIISMFINTTTQKKVLALFFSGLFGWLYMILIYYSMMIYFYAISNAILYYITAQFFISILFILGPIFFLFLLFTITKEMFDNWLKALISFSLQQIFLIATLSFFNQILISALRSSLGYKICWDNILSISFQYRRIELMSFWTIAGIYDTPASQKEFIDFADPKMMPSFYSIMYIMVVATLMKKFITMMTDVANIIGEGVKATSLGSDVAKKFESLDPFVKNSFARNAVSRIYNSTLGQVVNRADKFFFDSGKIADEERAILKKQDSFYNQHISNIKAAGNNSISTFKRENAQELIGKSKEEQREILKLARDKGIQEYASKNGLSGTDVDMIMNKSGLNYRGNNVFGAALAAAKQTYHGKLLNPLSDQRIKTSFSQSEAKEALSNMKPEEQKSFIEAAKSEIRVRESAAQFVSKMAKNPFNTANKLRKDLVKEVGGKLGNAYEAMIYNNQKAEAAKFLEKTGKIKRIGGLTSFFRSASEKDLIEQQYLQDKEDAARNTYRGSSANAIKELNRNVENSKTENKKEDNVEKPSSSKIKDFFKVFSLANRKEKLELANQKAEATKQKIHKEKEKNRERIENLRREKDGMIEMANSIGKSPREEREKQKYLVNAKRIEKQMDILNEKQNKINDYEDGIIRAKLINEKFNLPENRDHIKGAIRAEYGNISRKGLDLVERMPIIKNIPRYRADKFIKNAEKEFLDINSEEGYLKYNKKYSKYVDELSS